MPRTLIHDQLGSTPGNYTVETIEVTDWGSRVIVDCTYRHSKTDLLQLIFDGVLSIEWYVQANAQKAGSTPAQLMTHDLGEGNYKRTARLATTLAEVIIAYDKLKIIRQAE